MVAAVAGLGEEAGEAKEEEVWDGERRRSGLLGLGGGAGLRVVCLRMREGSVVEEEKGEVEAMDWSSRELVDGLGRGGFSGVREE